MQPVNSITEAIIGDAIAVHRELGPGLLESTYETCLAILLTERGMDVERQFPLPIVFRGRNIASSYRADMLVERRVVIELKSVTTLGPMHFAQMMTYLKFSNCEVGLLINFNEIRLVDGLRRIVKDYKPPESG